MFGGSVPLADVGRVEVVDHHALDTVLAGKCSHFVVPEGGALDSCGSYGQRYDRRRLLAEVVSVDVSQSGVARDKVVVGAVGYFFGERVQVDGQNVTSL